MRILVLLTDAFGGYGGIAKYNRDLLTALCAREVCVEVVAIPRLMPDVVKTTLPKLTYVTQGLNSKIKYTYTLLKTVLRRPQFNLIICGHINLMPFAFFFRLWLKAPIILQIYGIEAWHPIRNPIRNQLLKSLNAFISISGLTKNRFLSWSGLPHEKGFILPNAVDMSAYGLGEKNPVLLNRYRLAEKTVLMTMGRISASERLKGIDQMLMLIPTLAEEIPSIAYLVVGDGDDKERLIKKSEDLGISDRVFFTGYVEECEKADHFRLADVYVMPSIGEGFGFVFLEAMACGIPVIASKMDGGREAVRFGKLGILVDPENSVEIRNAIHDALTRKREIPEGLDYFLFDNFKRRLYSIIDEII